MSKTWEAALLQSFESVASAISALQPEKRQRVAKLCSERGLSKAAEIRILHAICELANLRLDRGLSVRTPKESAAALLAVAKSAHDLFLAISNLSLRDAMSLQMETGHLAKGWPADFSERYVPVPTPAQLEAVERVAQSLADEISARSAAGGRRPTLERYAAHIGQVWRAVDGYCVQPGRGGDFERLCDAVFELSGIPSKAEGAVRHFKEHILPTLQRKDPIQDSFESAFDAFILRLVERIADEDLRKNPPAQAAH